MLGHPPARAWDTVFEATALQHFEVLYRQAVSYTRNPDDAQDLVQDTYLRAYRFWYRFAPGTHLRAWLCTILRHTFINTYRREARYQALVDAAAWPLESVATAPAPAWPDGASMDEMLRYVVHDEVKNALDDLPDEYRLVVILADLAECTYKDIATMVGCPVGTVMSRLFRGRRLLRQRLETFARQSGYLRSEPERQPQARLVSSALAS